MHEIRYDGREHILHLVLSGFWDEAALGRFTADLLARLTTLRNAGQRYGVLSDSRAFAIQSPAVAAGFERLMTPGVRGGSGPTAVVVAGMLSKLQAERSLAGGNVRVFLDEGEARAWLVAELASASA